MKAFSYLFMLSLFLCFQPLSAAWVVEEGRVLDASQAATLKVEEHFNLGCDAVVKCDWKGAKAQFATVYASFPDSSQAEDAKFLLGVSYYRSRNLDLGQYYLEEYLESGGSRYFDLCLRYLLATAESYRNGAKRHLFGSERLPVWLPAYKQAEEIYDRIITSYPGHEYAAKAMIGKGRLLCERRRYPESVSAFYSFIQRFPKHELVPDVYCHIADTYLEQAKRERRNPDLLLLADMNLMRFTSAYPRDERASKVDASLSEMREIYAEGLYETAQFYERRSQPTAAVLYYQNAIQQFSGTRVADSCGSRLQELEPSLREAVL